MQAINRRTQLLVEDERATGAAAENVFRKEGEFWTIAYAGGVIRLKDRLGLFYVALLLAQPHDEMLAFDMVQARPSRGRTTRRAHANPEAHAGPLLDGRAIAEYRHRHRELRAELELTAGVVGRFGERGRGALERSRVRSLEVRALPGIIG